MVSSSSRPQTPGRSPPPDAALPPIPEGSNKASHPPRRSSLGFLRRSKSGESVTSRSSNKLSKKEKYLREQERIRQEQAVPKLPPTLPNFAPSPEIRSFGGENARPESLPAPFKGRYARGSMDNYASNKSSVPMPPVPVDPYARTESMTHRGRYSYASSAVSTINSPRRVRRRKDPTPFNILVLGTRNSGKTSFLNFLHQSLSPPSKRSRHTRGEDDANTLPPPLPNTGMHSSFTSHYLETEIDGERIGLTLWDSQGLERNVVDIQLREMSLFLESKFEETFTEEMKVVRAPGVQDTHIHCAFLLLDPVRLDSNIAVTNANGSAGTNGMNGKYVVSHPNVVGGLDENLDLQVLRALQGKTTVVPVISKADTITNAHMAHLKRTVWDSLKKANLDPLEALGLDDRDGSGSDRSSALDERDEDEALFSDGEPGQGSPKGKTTAIAAAGARAKRDPSPSSAAETPYLPLSIISPDIYDPGTIGRKFPWGFADPYNVDHCDFVRLKEAVFTEWRGELREASRELWYEGWRTSRLRRRGGA